MRLEGIAIRDFPPFARHAIRFGARHPECRADVHIFVGQNGTGKTRLLTLLLAALGNRKDLEDRTSSHPEAAVFASKVEDRGATSLLFWQGANSLKFRDNVEIKAKMAAYLDSGQIGGKFEHIGQDLIGSANDRRKDHTDGSSGLGGCGRIPIVFTQCEGQRLTLPEHREYEDPHGNAFGE